MFATTSSLILLLLKKIEKRKKEGDRAKPIRVNWLEVFFRRGKTLEQQVGLAEE